MTDKFNVNKPFFGFVTVGDPKDGYVSSTATYAYACSQCNDAKNALKHEKNAHALDSIEATRIQDHLRSQIAKLNKEYVVMKQMQTRQAQTILEKSKTIEDFEAKFKDKFGHTLPEYQNLVKEQDMVIRKLDKELVAVTNDLAEIKKRNLDPEPHKLKAAILVMQKQIDELTAALVREQTEHNEDNGMWAKRYERDIDKCKNEILTLKHENTNIKNHYCCECDASLVPKNKETQRLQEEKRIMQQKIEDQNRKIGSKQEDINKLKIALNKAKEKQTFEMKPAVEIMREYEDKIRRLIDVANSKDDIIAGLQGALMGKK